MARQLSQTQRDWLRILAVRHGRDETTRIGPGGIPSRTYESLRKLQLVTPRVIGGNQCAWLTVLGYRRARDG